MRTRLLLTIVGLLVLRGLSLLAQAPDPAAPPAQIVPALPVNGAGGVVGAPGIYTPILGIGGTTSTCALCQTEFTKIVTGLADAVATTVLTVTVPNAAHGALVSIEVVASLGAGGVVGAFEASTGGRFLYAVTRVGGVAAVSVAASMAESTGSA